jgi:hypothetical protein
MRETLQDSLSVLTRSALHEDSFASKEIPLSRGKMLRGLVICAVFVLISLWLISIKPSMRADPGALVLLRGIGWGAIATFGFFGALIGKKYFDKRVGLTLDQQGITDFSSAIGAGFVPWADVTGFGIQEVQGTRNVIVMVRNPEHYIAKAGMLTRMAYRANLKLIGSPLAISPVSLQIGFDELWNLLHGYAEMAGRLHR